VPDVTRGAFETRLTASQDAVFAFHERPDVMALLTPWWSGVRVVRPAPSLLPGQRALLRLGFGPLAIEWLAEHTVYEPPREFEDIQLSGPFKRWRHRHRVLPAENGTMLRDEIEYALPGGPLAPILDRLLMRPFLERLFRYRHAVTRRYSEGRVAAS
jgi:ligand-binding SRPBCC domain-containing protein